MTTTCRHQPHLIPNPCPLCGSTQVHHSEILYPVNFRPEHLTATTFSARRLPDKLHYQLVKCQHDGLVRSTPILPAKALAKLYERSQVTYQQEVPFLQATYMRALQPVLTILPKSARILELGSGNGFMLAALREQGFRQVTGIEPSRSAIAQAPAAIRRQLMNGTFESIKLKANSFDLIFILQTLDHLPDPNAVLAKAYRLLKRGGYIVTYHHNIESWSHRLLRERHPIIDIEHTHLYSPKTTAALFEAQGFIVKKIWSPANVLSLQHLAWLLPLPKFLKKWYLNQNWPWSRLSLTLQLGNTAAIVQKP